MTTKNPRAAITAPEPELAPVAQDDLEALIEEARRRARRRRYGYAVVLALAALLVGGLFVAFGGGGGGRSAAHARAAQRTSGRSVAAPTGSESTGDPWQAYQTQVIPGGGLQLASARVGFALSGQPIYGLDQNLSSPGAPMLAWPSPSVMVTSDGGRHWTRALAAPAGFWGVDAIAANDVWAVGVTALYRSVDGGTTWQRVSEPRKPLVRVVFTSPTRGFGLTVNGRLVQTIDSGASWTASRWHARSQAMCSMSGGAVLIAGETGGVWRMASSGGRWLQVARGLSHIEQYAGWPTQLSCQGSNAVELSQAFCEAACGGGIATNIRQTTDDGRVWRTLDLQQVGAGATRSQPQATLNASIEGVAALGASRACLVTLGQDGPPADLRIGCTGPAGTGYQKAFVPRLPFGPKRNLANVQGIDFLNASTGWLLVDAGMGSNVGGPHGSRAKTEILTTHNGGVTWQDAYISPTYAAVRCPGSLPSEPVCWENPLG